MWKIPVTSSEAIPFIMEAAERDGYLGLMIILARTAEARTLHRELSRDWTSIHDVTGHRIAVMCPDPSYMPPEESGDRSAEQMAYVEGEARFWSNLSLDECPDLGHTRIVVPARGGVLPRPEYPEDVQQAAWTEAVTRCAGFFGIPESRLPAVMIRCFQDERDVLIQLRPDTSLYLLCKEIASNPGYQPGDDALLKKRALLAEASPTRRPRVRPVWTVTAARTARELLAVGAVRKRAHDLGRHLRLIADVDPAWHRHWAGALSALIRSDSTCDIVQAVLTEMIASAAAHDPRSPGGSALKSKVRKLKKAITAAALPSAVCEWVPESAEEKTRREDEEERERTRRKAELAEVERQLAGRPGLAQACEAAARTALGECEAGYLPCTAGADAGRRYSPERIYAVRPAGRRRRGPGLPGSSARNDFSGRAGNSVIQAQKIDAVHIHEASRPSPARTFWSRMAKRKHEGRAGSP